MRNLLTTQDQNFYRELILKEAYTRLAWKMKYSGEYPISSTTRRSKSIGFFNPPSVSKVTLPPVVQTQKRKTPEVTRRVLSEAPLMRPVSSQTKASLYDGKGRRLYLKKRTEQGPEEKYDHPVLSSWDYGWRLGKKWTFLVTMKAVLMLNALYKVVKHLLGVQDFTSLSVKHFLVSQVTMRWTVGRQPTEDLRS